MATFQRYSDAVKAGMKFSAFITNPTDAHFPQGWHHFAQADEARDCADTEAKVEQRVVYTIGGAVFTDGTHTKVGS